MNNHPDSATVDDITPDPLREALEIISEGRHPNGHRGAVLVARAALASSAAPRPEGLDAAYRERNAVVAALIRTHRDWPCWIVPAPDADDWWIVYAETPEGQVSWHFGPDDLDLFGGLENANGEAWDGHTTEQKYSRLARLSDTGDTPDGAS